MTTLQRGSVNKAKGMGVGMGSGGKKKPLNFILKKKKKDGVKRKFPRESDLLALESGPSSVQSFRQRCCGHDPLIL